MITAASRARVAVVVPVYRAHYLSEALESIFFQSSLPDEVILVDDGSPDQHALQQAVEPFAARVRLLRQPNRGAGAARNAGILATTAELIALLDADDRWLPDFLSDQIEAVAARAADVAYANVMLIGRTPLAGRSFMSMCPSRGEVTLETLLAQECNIPLSATVVRRQAMVNAGLFDTSLRRGQDFDLWLRLARNGAVFSYTEKVLGLRRIHDANLSGTHVNGIERALNVFNKTLTTMDLTIAERAAAERRVAALTTALACERGKVAVLQGDYAAARVQLAAAADRGGWKVRAALFGLRVAPAMVQRILARKQAAALADQAPELSQALSS